VSAREEDVMNRDQLKGKLDELKGKVKKDVSDVFNDRSGQAKGAIEEKEGQARKAVGDVEEKVKERREEPEQP